MNQTKQIAPNLARIVLENVKRWRKEHHKPADPKQQFRNEPRILKLSKNPPKVIDIDPVTGEAQVDP